MPLNRKYPIAELIAACRRYPGASNARRITFEYVMLKGVNDSEAEARELVRLIAGMPAKVNLIPFNPWPGSPFETSSNSAIDRFARIVMDAGFASPVRYAARARHPGGLRAVEDGKPAGSTGSLIRYGPRPGAQSAGGTGSMTKRNMHGPNLRAKSLLAAAMADDALGLVDHQHR